MTTDRTFPDPEAEELLDRAFPDAVAPEGPPRTRLQYALIPTAVVQATPEEFASFLDAAFSDAGDVEQLLERNLGPGDGATRAGHQSVRALIPAQLLDSHGLDPERLLDEVFVAFDDIEELLATLEDRRRAPGSPTAPPALAVVPDEVAANPELLLRVVDRMRTEAEKLELLLRQARHALGRLQPYRLSRRPRGQLLAEMRHANRIADLQYLIDFLRSIQLAADSFERLDLPRPHIRDYLEHLYSIEDWDRMAELVQSLRQAVVRFLAGDARGEP